MEENGRAQARQDRCLENPSCYRPKVKQNWWTEKSRILKDEEDGSTLHIHT
jgi:hypothetical protein